MARQRPVPLLNSLIFGTYNKMFKPNRTPNDWICSDDAVVDKYMADPLCGFDATIGLARDMLTGIRMNQEPANLAKMNKALPVLFVSGAKDPVGGMAKGVLKTIDAFKRTGLRNITIHIYPEGRHEMLNEVNRARSTATCSAGWRHSERSRQSLEAAPESSKILCRTASVLHFFLNFRSQIRILCRERLHFVSLSVIIVETL